MITIDVNLSIEIKEIYFFFVIGLTNFFSIHPGTIKAPIIR